MKLQLLAQLMLACVLAACSGQSESDRLASGTTLLNKGDPLAAALQFKSVLQDAPDNAQARFLLGRALTDAGDPASGALELRKALDLGHARGEALPLLATAMLTVGQSKKLLDDYGTAVIQEPAANAILQAALANAQYQVGNFAAAATQLDGVLAASPELPPALMLKARLQLRENQVDAAIATLQGLISRRAGGPEPHLLSGDIMLRAKGDAAAAEAHYLKALEVDARSIPAHSGLIELALRQKKIETMQQRLAALKQTFPTHPQTRFHEAQLALLERQYQKARELTQGLLTMAPDSVEALHLAGLAESGAGNLRLARDRFAKALFIAPARADVRLLLAQTYLQTGQSQQVLDLLRDALLVPQPNAIVLEMAAKARMQMGNFDTARELFLRAQKAAPDKTDLQTSLAWLDYSSGKVSAAARQLEQASAQDKSPTADFMLIALHVKQRAFDQAMAIADGLTAKGVEPAQIALLKGQVALQQGDPAKARQQFDAALLADPAMFEASSSLANIELAEGKIAAAQAVWRRLLEKQPNNATAMAELARVLHRGGAPREQVVELLDSAIRAEPTDPRNRTLLVDYHLSRRDFKAALSAAQAADAVLPNSADVLERLGRSQLASGNSQQAVGSFRRLAQLKPKAPEPYFMMAEAYVAVNDQAAADTVLRQAVAAAPDSPAAYRELAMRLLRTKREADAFNVARSLQKRLPTRADGHLLESELHATLKDREGTVRALRAGMAVADDSKVAMRLYRVLVAEKQTKQADALAVDWTKRHPDDLAFRRTLGDIHMQSHAYTVAEQQYQEVLRLAPNDSQVLNNMAWLRHRTGKPDALSYAERAYALDGANLNVMDTLAQILVRNQQVPRAVELAKRILQAPDGNVPLKLSAANLLVKVGAELPLVSSQLDDILRSDNQPFVAAEVKRLRAAMKPT